MACKEQQLPSTQGDALRGVDDAGAKTRQECQDLCSADWQCSGLVWTRTGTNCYLKQAFDASTVTWRTGSDTQSWDFCCKGVSPVSVALSLVRYVILCHPTSHFILLRTPAFPKIVLFILHRPTLHFVDHCNSAKVSVYIARHHEDWDDAYKRVL